MLYLGLACMFLPPLALMILADEMSYRRQKRYLNSMERTIESMIVDLKNWRK